jgi:hypothetical protein
MALWPFTHPNLNDSETHPVRKNKDAAKVSILQ